MKKISDVRTNESAYFNITQEEMRNNIEKEEMVEYYMPISIINNGSIFDLCFSDILKNNISAIYIDFVKTDPFVDHSIIDEYFNNIRSMFFITKTYSSHSVIMKKNKSIMPKVILPCKIFSHVVPYIDIVLWVPPLIQKKMLKDVVNIKITINRVSFNKNFEKKLQQQDKLFDLSYIFNEKNAKYYNHLANSFTMTKIGDYNCARVDEIKYSMNYGTTNGPQ